MAVYYLFVIYLGAITGSCNNGKFHDKTFFVTGSNMRLLVLLFK